MNTSHIVTAALVLGLLLTAAPVLATGSHASLEEAAVAASEPVPPVDASIAAAICSRDSAVSAETFGTVVIFGQVPPITCQCSFCCQNDICWDGPHLAFCLRTF